MSFGALEALFKSKTYQHWCPCCPLSACPLSASPCWCHRPQLWIPEARLLPLWSSCWKCPATTASAWIVPPAASAVLVESEHTPGNGRQCHLQGRVIKNIKWGMTPSGVADCFYGGTTKTAVPVPPATSRSRTPGCGCMTWSNISFHIRWIPRLMASFMTSYFWATFSKTLYTEKAKRKRGHLCHLKPFTVYYMFYLGVLRYSITL